MTNLNSKIGKDGKTLGQRLNNLTCIRYSRYNSWNGQIGFSKGFCKFISNEYCLRATVIILCRYVFTYFSTSVSEIIYRWAPPSDGNDTKSYVSFVSEYVDNFINKTDFRECSDDFEFYRLLTYIVCAIALIESNSNLLSGRFVQRPLISLVTEYCKEYCVSVLHVPSPYQALLKYKLSVPY